MKYDNVKYGILLSREQLDFLKDDRQGFHRPKALDAFLSLAAMEPFRYEKKNFSADLGIGQFAISKVEFAELWGCDRKTAQKMVDLFQRGGYPLIRRQQPHDHPHRPVSGILVRG